jgi:hypothetical protein
MKPKSGERRARKSASAARPRNTRTPAAIDTSDILPLTDEFFSKASRNPYPALDAATLRQIRKRVPQGRIKVREKLF